MKRKVHFAFKDQDVTVELATEDIPSQGDKVLWPDTDIEFIVSRVCRDFSAGLDVPPSVVLTLDAWGIRGEATA
ncbi:hypothetical protein [Streptomyces sp. NPDC005336]|uniref:hypothetical protein n=1 Tax=Streptomyces sp. NPDC005336 TaxID=3157035 RepID=UPI0033A8729B